MIDFNGLEEQCPMCNGRGEIENTTWYHNLPVRNYKFEIVETKDKPHRIHNKVPNQKDDSIVFFCRNCNGRGRILTAQGKRLMEFIRFWMNSNY